MSRRTPPNSKVDEKLNVPVSTTGISTTSNSSTSSNVSNMNVTLNNNGSGRPGSPRIGFRVTQVSRTPDKNQKHHEDSTEREDVYEFCCSKEEIPEESTSEHQQDDSKSELSPSSNEKGEKRQRENEQDDDDETKKKRKKDDVKECGKTALRPAARPAAASPDKVNKNSRSNGSSAKQSFQTASTTISSTISSSTASVVASTTATSTHNTTLVSSNAAPMDKTPSNATANSPLPATASKNSSTCGDSDNEEGKNECSSGAPKVPPLKIVLAPTILSEQEIHVQNGSNRQLPYVVSSNAMEEKEGAAAAADPKDVTKPEEVTASSAAPTSSSASTVITSSVASTETATSSSSNGAHVSTSTASSSTPSTTSASNSDKPPRMTRSQKGGSGGSSSGEETAMDKQEVKDEPCSTPSSLPVSNSSSMTQQEALYPRKRKIRLKEPENEAPPAPVIEQQQQQPVQVSNCYEMFLKMRKQVERRRRQLFPVQPKPPDGFKNYLMNRCSYALANNTNSQLSVPIIPPPASLCQLLKDLFTEQEKDRHKLKLQHQIEQTKLVLSVEQEILRVHGRAARALASQVLPFSVCTILKDEEVYNIITLEQEEKDRNLRSRYNGRHFFSWLQEVDDKWEKIKEDMVLRHHNEAESLHAVQKMDWEWKLKELNLVDANTRPQIDELHVPMVIVSDFNLLPA